MDERILQIVLKARDEASKEIEKVGKAAGGVADLLSKSFKSAAIVSGVALGGLVLEAKSAISSFMESEQVMAQTEAVIRSTGSAAGLSASEISNMAGKLQSMTGMSDETIQSGQNLLLTFTNIGKDIFPSATQAMLDMSVALGQDVSGSATQLGKALQDPILGVSALRRVGVNFSEDQQNLIKTMVESGHTMDAQKFILKELQTEFGGSAEAAGHTFKGELDKLKGSFDNIQESIGKLLTDKLAPFVPKLTAVADAIKKVVDGESSLSSLTATLSEEFGKVGEVVGKVVEFFGTHQDALTALGGAFGGVLALGIGAATVAMLGFIGISAPVLAAAAVIGGAIALISSHWADITQFFQNLGVLLAAKFEELKEGIKGFIDNTVAWFQQLPSSVESFLVDLFWVKIPYYVGFAAGWLSTAIPNMIGSVIAWFQQLPERVGTFLGQTKDWIVNKLTEAWAWVSTNVPTWPGKIADYIKGIPEKVSKIFDDTKEAALGKLESLWKGIQDIWDKIKGVLDGIKNKAEDAWNAVQRGFNAGKSAGMSFADGGWVPQTGMALVHQGEFVLSRDMLSGRDAIPSNINTTSYQQPISITALINNEVDFGSVGYELAWQLRNSR